jgi:hypothetical protein
VHKNIIRKTGNICKRKVLKIALGEDKRPRRERQDLKSSIPSVIGGQPPMSESILLRLSTVLDLNKIPPE